MKRSFQFPILALLLVFVLVSICCLVFRSNFYLGWIVAIVCTSIVIYVANHVVSKPKFIPTSLFALPLVTLSFFGIALMSSLRHPPFIASENWEWPPFDSIATRLTHAFALSLWSIPFGTFAFLVAGIVRRTLLWLGKRSGSGLFDRSIK